VGARDYRAVVSAGELSTASEQLRPKARLVRLLGAAVALAAIALCGRALGDSWSSVRFSLRHAHLTWLVPALVCAAAAMAGLALQWWRWLRELGFEASPLDAAAWYLGAELGKYLPGGVWTVLGRGELAHRGGGLDRARAYASTLLGYATMCVAAAVVCGVCGPVAAATGGPAWGWAFGALLPLHPVLLRRALTIGRTVSRGRLDAATPTWAAAGRLVAWAVPSWVLLGVFSVGLTRLLGLDAVTARIMLAAVAAWTVGFLAVPVPAGAGIREIVFVALCGLPAGSAVAVALLSRAALVLVDALLGAGGLAVTARRSRHRPAAASASPARSVPEVTS
jgi:hypothetical protein